MNYLPSRKNRILLGALAAAVLMLLLITLLPTNVDAETEGDFAYSVFNDEATIIKYTGSDDAVAIPAALGGYPVTTIGGDAFCDCIYLTELTIPCSIKRIGANAFYGCARLKTIVITDPNAWCKILYENYYAYPTSYGDCVIVLDEKGAEVTELVLDETVKYIPGSAFYNCTSLTSVTIPDSVTFIGESAFRDCTGLTSVTIGDSVTTIYDSAFSGCSGLKELTIGDSVTTIDDYAFAGCRGLPELAIPDSVTTINWGAFYNCTGLTKVTIPDGVLTLDSCAFYNCTGLSELIIGDGVITIGGQAFYSCLGLTSVTVGNSVDSIGAEAFYICNNLKDVYYAGTQADWETISISSGNSKLEKATIHYSHTHDDLRIPPVIVPATCTKAGYTEYTCVCGKTYRESVPALGHTVQDGVCTVCGENNFSDFTGDGQVTDADAIYLLRNTLFPESYPLSGNGDINCDGQVTDADAIYLLRHTLFPESYPLYPKKED